jgi:hypothetical protein
MDGVTFQIFAANRQPPAAGQSGQPQDDSEKGRGGEGSCEFRHLSMLLS